jgi:hypothetical protein
MTVVAVYYCWRCCHENVVNGTDNSRSLLAGPLELGWSNLFMSSVSFFSFWPVINISYHCICSNDTKCRHFFHVLTFFYPVAICGQSDRAVGGGFCWWKSLSTKAGAIEPCVKRIYDVLLLLWYACLYDGWRAWTYSHQDWEFLTSVSHALLVKWFMFCHCFAIIHGYFLSMLLIWSGPRRRDFRARFFLAF